MRFTITVPFVRGKLRPRYATASKRMYTPTATARSMEAIRDEWRRVAGKAYAAEKVPVRVDITCERSVPDSRPRRVDAEPDTYKPDADNVAKLVLDALNGVAWKDDSQVVSLHVRKTHRRRDADERTTVSVEWEG